MWSSSEFLVLQYMTATVFLEIYFLHKIQISSHRHPRFPVARCILIYNSVLKWQHANLKNGARTPRTVTKFAVKTAIYLTKVI